MDTRKIQKVGGGTFTVSLPQDWAQAEAISQGVVVDVHTHIDGMLVVQTRNLETEPTGSVRMELRGDTGTEHVLQSLWAAYIAGYTEIVLTTQDTFTSSQRRAANEVTNVLGGATGGAIAEQEITVRVLLDHDEISVRQLVRQLSFIALSMHETACDDTRYRIVRLLTTADRALCVCELTPVLDVSDSAVSHALSDLRDAGLVTREKDGQWRYYEPSDRALALVDALGATEGSR